MSHEGLVLAGIFGEIGELVARSGVFAKLIVLLLFVLSVISWAVMAERGRAVQRMGRANREFWRRFDRARGSDEGIREVARWSRGKQHSPLARILVYFTDTFLPLYERQRAEGEPHHDLLLGVLRRGVERESALCMDDQERGLGWLATLTSIAPFLGLLGTVWGIMGSFMELGRQGSATLDVVGPGIAEALITTVCGLAVAIPSAVGYNYFMRRLQQQEGEMRRLGSVLADVVAEEELSRRPARVY
jgi:biopolymer transport protein TolQ